MPHITIIPHFVGQEQQRSDIFGQVKKLKDCISILFNFHRQPIREDEFVKNTRSWTERLVRILSVLFKKLFTFACLAI